MNATTVTGADTTAMVVSNKSNISAKTQKPSGLCARLAYGTANCIKLFGFGIAAAGIGTPLTVGIVNISQLLGYVPDVDLETMCKLKPMIANPIGGAAIGLIIPIAEEILFRGLVQDVLLTRIPKYIVKKTLPGKETVFDAKIAQAVRIILTAALFSAAHSLNDGTLPDSYVKAQLIATFVGGVGLGVLKESASGLLSAIGGHSANNLASIAYTLYIC